MKSKKILCATALLLVSSFTFQSCIGSFSLTNKVLSWNKNVSNKFLNEVVFFAFWVLPVYEVTAVADLLVINSIEFWSGNQPLEARNQVIKTENGDYFINAREDGYNITSPDGNHLSFNFDEETQTWSFNLNDGENTDFLKIKDQNHVQVLNQEGIFVDVELSRQGVDKYAASLGLPMMATL